MLSVYSRAERLAFQRRFQMLKPIMRILEVIYESFSIILVYPLKGYFSYRALLVASFVSFSSFSSAKKLKIFLVA